MSGKFLNGERLSARLPEGASVFACEFSEPGNSANQAKPSSAPKGAVRPERLVIFTRMRENGGSNMPVALPEPDGGREGIPPWLCPHCKKLKRAQDYGWKARIDDGHGK